jgi:lysophospholipase L1-like esterase
MTRVQQTLLTFHSILVGLLLLFLFTANTVFAETFKTVNGEVVIEAEKYTRLGGSIGGTWFFNALKSGYKGTGYIESSKDDPSTLIYTSDIIRAEYDINFQCTGTYYVHLRTYAEDRTQNGFFASVDGNQVDYGHSDAFYIWVSQNELNPRWWWYTDGGGAGQRGLKVSFNITSPGKKTFAVLRRNKGSRIDRIWLTKNESNPQNTDELNLPDPSNFIDTPAEVETNCTDGLDNDGDGLIDCLDSDCNGVSGCEFGSEITCDDAIDNDEDGLTDCDDPDCNSAPSCIPETVCDDGIDNDGDGFTDCDDPDCIGLAGCGSTIFSTGFNSGTDGFTYSDDTFRGTNHPAYASGDYVASGGYSGGGLHVYMGGIDFVSIVDGLSGGWTRSFTVVGDDVVSITLRYRLFFPSYYEPDECGQALVAVDGNLVGPGSADYLKEYCGTDSDQDSGWQQVTFDVSLTGGTHTITVGGYNSKKTGANEVTDVFFDDIVITQQGQVSVQETNCTDGLDNDGDGLIDCLDSDCNGVSGCEFGSEITCDDAIDNDEDGLTDCDDPDCNSAPSCIPETVCDDGIDNDGDGFTDCDDPDCIGLAGCGSTIFSTGFNSGTDGFTYSDDTFRGTNHPAYASGDYVASGGYSGGGLHVYMGGIDFVSIVDGLSGGWTRSFTVVGDDVVSITLRYRLFFPSYYEPDECGQALVAVDGNLVGPGSADYLKEYCGTDSDQDSGWQQVTFDVSLTGGTHTITVGGYNNKKTGADEVTDVFFDDIEIVQKNATNIIFFDDFNDGTANGWSVEDIPNRTSNWQIVGGKYAQLNRRVDGFEDSYHIGSFSYYQDGMSLSDYQVDLKMKFQADIVNDPRDTIGIMFRYQDSNNYYRFAMSNMQGFRRLIAKKNGVFSTLAFDGRPAHLGEESDVSIVVKTIDANRSKILVYMNDEHLFSVEDSNHIPDGSIALFTQSYAEFDNVLISDISQTPRVILQQPTSFSVPVTDSDTGPYELDVSAQGLNVPMGYGVKFIIDSGSPSEIVDYTNTYSGTFDNVPQGNRTINALIVDAGGNPLSDPMGQDQDTNGSVGMGGKFVVSMGDSITNGFGDTIMSDNNALNGRILSRGYTPILTNLISNEVNKPVFDVNEGLGGTISADGRNRLAATITCYPESQIWLILFGTIDSGGIFPVESGVSCQENPNNFDPSDPSYNPDCINTFKDNIRTMILDLLAQNKIPVLAMVPFVKNAPQLRDDTINDYNQVIHDLYVFHNLPVEPPDFYSYFSANQGEFYDNVHPNGNGYISIANEWFNKLMQSLILN